MPVTLPQLHESLFCSYDPSFVPGYTGFTQKVLSDKGHLYGNSTLKSVDYEPGQRCSQLAVNHRGRDHSPLVHVPLGGRSLNSSRGDTETWNNKNGYFHPLSEKYYYTQFNHTYDGNPETSSAIKAIEEIKYELIKPAEWTSSEKTPFHLLRDGGIKEKSQYNGTKEQVTEKSRYHSHRNENMKKMRNDITEKELITSLYNSSDYLQRRQGKLIYRTDCSLLPNYSGYTPGQMFAIGSTWGRSSVNAIGKLQEQSFQWTSLF